MNATYRLSKSRFQSGLQCPKSLWLKVHAPQLADPLTERQQAVFADGNRVGELARSRFPGGILVAEDHLHGAEALETTRRLLAEGAEVLYEAALENGGVFVRADVLVRRGDEWDLVEVKSSTKCKPEHLTDAAVQAHALQGEGLVLGRAYVMHLDGAYVHGRDGYDLERLFTLSDLTQEVRAYLPCVPGEVRRMLAMLAGECPEARIGRHCGKPYDCAFIGHCHGFLPEHPVTEIPRISAEALDALLAGGIHSILDVPVAHPLLTALQRETCEVVRSGLPRIRGDLAETLRRVSFPAHFLDFETFKPALPLFPRTRPHQQLPFQFSDHVVHPGGAVEHREFLHEEDGDPRPAFIEALLDTVDGEGSVVVYSGFENTILNALARDFPEHAEGIAGIQRRLFDLRDVVLRHIRHPDFHGSTSIKRVLPALVDDLGYEGLAIRDGDTAMLRYEASVRGELPAAQRARLFGDLREYCGTDTMAMVRLFERFSEIAGEGAA